MDARPWRRRFICQTGELARIKALSRRSWTDADLETLRHAMTDVLRTTSGTMTLNVAQGLALHDIGEFGGLVGPIRVGGGKCLGRGTPVLMFNGTVKSVEDVLSGDSLMGPDGAPRHVLSTCKGFDMLYRVTPVKGDTYTVNQSHILSLKKTGCDEILNIPVLEYLKRGWNRPNCNWKGWRSAVDFPTVPAREPYMLGVWLGDGSSNRPDFTTMDEELEDEIVAFSHRMGTEFRLTEPMGNASRTFHLTSATYSGPKDRNAVLEWLRDLGVLGNKHIPHSYKVNSVYVRQQVLAGLLDTDGHLHRGGYDYISKLERLADDVCFIARSLGLAAYKSKCIKGCQTGAVGTYYRVSISGDCSHIPCRLPRKRAPERIQKKSVLMTGLTVEPAGEGEYFGFELSGPDRLFLLGDFTVTHNTIISLLAPYVLEARRPLLLAPASLLAKTTRERRDLQRHWRIPHNLQMRSYEILGRINASDELRRINPDLIIADEAHKLKNRKAGVTRRVVRFMKENPGVRFVAISGTLMKDSIKDFAHIMKWALKSGAPVPDDFGNLEEWSDALDERVNPLRRMEPGALLDLCEPRDFDDEEPLADRDVRAARRGFRRRMIETPGVVCTAGEDVAASMYISEIRLDASPTTEANFKTLRTLWETPDGLTFLEAVALWRYARQLALGFHYSWFSQEDFASCVKRETAGNTLSPTERQMWTDCVNMTESGTDLARVLGDLQKSHPSTGGHHFVGGTGSTRKSTSACSICSGAGATFAGLGAQAGSLCPLITIIERGGLGAFFASHATSRLDCWAILLRHFPGSWSMLGAALHAARPPQAWMTARRVWGQFVRETLAHSRTLDTELQVARACEKGGLDDTAFRGWKDVQPTYTPEPRPVWHDDIALRACQAWMAGGPGIVWTEHAFFAEELAKRTGRPYFGAKGLDRAGRPIEDASGVIIASIAANGTGRNLQRWSRNLITSCPSSPVTLEQLLGRTHRRGQEADTVTVDVFVGCREQWAALVNARAFARTQADTIPGAESQKILIADLTWPEESEIRDLDGYRWRQTSDLPKNATELLAD